MYMTDRFTADEDERLIAEVSGLPMLWRVRDPDFKNSDKKEQAWNMIAQMIKKTGAQCKIRWRSIRDHYKRQRKQERLGLNGGTTHKKRAIYWEMLTFLDHEEEHDREMISSTADLHEMLYEPLEDQEQEPQRIDSEDYASPEDISIATSFCTTSIADSPEDLKAEADAECVPLKRRRSQKLALKKIKGMRKKNKRRKVVKETTDDGEDDDEDDIGLFFRTMAATVRKFEPNERTEAKMKIFGLVTEMELASQNA